jgi:hypothetical protein
MVKAKNKGKGIENAKLLPPVPVPAPQGEPAGFVIPQPNIIRLQIPIRGITPLVIRRFDQKTMGDMIEEYAPGADTKMKTQKTKDPEKEWHKGRWLSTEGWDGVNAGSFRAATISAARFFEKVTMVELKSAIFIIADGYADDGTPLVRIKGTPRRFTNMCRTSGIKAAPYPNHRPMYDPWECLLNVEVNGHILSAAAAVNLFAAAGRFCGVGEWRPTATKSMTGDFGRWELIQSQG